MIIFRDAHIRSSGYTLKGKDVKAPTQDDVDKLEARVTKGNLLKGTSSRSRHEVSKAMVAAAAASSEAGMTGFDREIFGGVGLAAMSLPNVKVFIRSLTAEE